MGSGGEGQISRHMDTRRRSHVLIKPNAKIAEELKASPGQWFIVGVGEKSQQKVLSQTAYRINLNYIDGRGLRDFAADKSGRFVAVSTADSNRPDPVAEVELRAVWLPVGLSADPGDGRRLREV
jgi:hypothetical protein